MPNNKLHPIEDIYLFIGADFDELGYNDATNVVEEAYLEQGLEIIIAGLSSMIKRAIEIYINMIKDCSNDIIKAERFSFAIEADKHRTNLEKIKAEKEKLEEILPTLSINSKNLPIIETYKQGFMRGRKVKFRE